MSERAAVGNAADEGQVNNARAQNKSDAALLRVDWQRVLSTGEGQRVVWSIMEYCGMNVTPFSQLASSMSFKVGRQDVGNFMLVQIMESKPDAYLEMITFAKRQHDAKKRPSKRELQDEATSSEGRAITEPAEDSDNAST